MSKILIGGAGGAPSEGVINSLLLSKKQEEIIGMGVKDCCGSGGRPCSDILRAVKDFK